MPTYLSALRRFAGIGTNNSDHLEKWISGLGGLTGLLGVLFVSQTYLGLNGGATALTAVTGGESIHAMGFHYVLTPVLLNVFVILSVAILFNLAFHWRRYPSAWARKPEPAVTPDDNNQAEEVFSRTAITFVGDAIDSTLGISKHNLETVCNLARCNTESGGIEPAAIRTGSYYCNGTFGPGWQVGQVGQVTKYGNSESPATNEDDILSYRVIAGNKRRHTEVISRKAFAKWTHYEVCQNENSWQCVEDSSCPTRIENGA